MTEHEYSQTEKRRTEGTAGRRYQQGGRGNRQSERQGGQMGQRSGQQTSYGTGGQMDPQSGHQTGGEMGRQMGGQTGHRSTGQTSPQTGGQMGQQTGSQMSGGQMGGRQTGGRMGGQQTDQRGRQSGQMGGRSSQQSESLIRPVTVSDVAATEVVTTQPDAPLSEVVQKMAREDVGSVVITEGNRPIGIVTDRKIALALGEISDASQLRAADLMSEDLFTVPEGTNVFDLVRRLSDKGVRRIPVVGNRGDLKGIVSLDDVVVLLAEEFYNVAEIIRKQSPRF